MQGIVFKELKSNAAIDVYRRNLQKMYVDKLIDLVKPTPPVDPALAALLAGAGGRRRGPVNHDVNKEMTDVVSIAKGQLRALNAMITSSLANTTDTMSKYHLQDLSDRITMALNPKG